MKRTKDGKFDFKGLYDSSSFYPETSIVVDVGEKQRKEGKPEEKILGDSLTFVHSMANQYYSRCVIMCNEAVSGGINDLGLLEAWPNLQRIARHAIETGKRVCERIVEKDPDEQIHAHMGEFFTFEQFILSNPGLSELEKILTPEAYKKYFPLNIAHDEKLKKNQK